MDIKIEIGFNWKGWCQCVLSTVINDKEVLKVYKLKLNKMDDLPYLEKWILNKKKDFIKTVPT